MTVFTTLVAVIAAESLIAGSAKLYYRGKL